MAETLPPVQIQLVAGGVEDVKKALKTVDTAIRNHYLNTARYAVQSAKVQQKAYDNLYKNIDRQADNHDSKAIAQQKSLNDKLLAQEKQLTQKLIAEYKTRGASFKDSLGKLGRGGVSAGSGVRVGGGANRNNLAAAAGTIFGIGAGGGVLGRTVQGASAGFGVGGLTGGAIGGAAALAAATVQKAFSVLISGIQSGAEAFFGAITQLGGGFDVSNAIAQVHKNNRTATQISAGTAFLSADERITSQQALGIANGTTKGTEFDQATGLAALQAWQAKTGDTKGFIENAGFLTSGASTFGNGDLVGFTNQLANTKTQFSNLSSGELTRVALGQMQQGQRGSIEFKDQASLATITAAAGSQTGDVAKNILFQTGLAQIAAPGAGGSTDEAATQIRAYNTAISKIARGQGKQAGEKSRLGLTTDSQGKVENYSDVLKKVVLMKPGEVPHTIASEVRGSSFIQSLKNKVSGNTDEERSASYDKLIKQFTDVSVSMEDFNKATKETTETVDYQLKTAFNELKQVIGDQVMPDLTNFAKSIKENQPLIESTIKTVITYFELLGQGISDFVNEWLLPAMKSSNQKALSAETNILEENKNTLQHKKNIQGGDYYKNATPEYRRTIDLQVGEFEGKVRRSEERVKYLRENGLNLDDMDRKNHMTPEEKKHNEDLRDESQSNGVLASKIDSLTPEAKLKLRQELNTQTNMIGPQSEQQQKHLDALNLIVKTLDESKDKKYSKDDIEKITAAIKEGFKEPNSSNSPPDPPNGG